MATTYYAWAPILYGAEVDPKTGVRNTRADKYIKIGDPVTKEDLGIDRDEFKALIDSGAVRKMRFPDDIPEGYQGSPVDWLRKKAAEAANDLDNGISALQNNATQPAAAPVKDDGGQTANNGQQTTTS